MLKQSTQLDSLSVASLHTGRDIDVARQAIINPYDLSVAGFYLDSGPGRVLLTQDVRELNSNQLIIDSEDVISESGDLLRLRDVLQLNYQPIGSLVRTKSGKKLGKVVDYLLDDVSWQIQKIHVKQPMWRNLTESALIIDRKQIIEVTDRSIVVGDATLRAGKLAPQQMT